MGIVVSPVIRTPGQRGTLLLSSLRKLPDQQSGVIYMRWDVLD